MASTGAPIALPEKTRRAMLKRLKAEAKSGDTEGAHSEADQVLCEALVQLGYIDLVDAYQDVPKWFA